VRACSAGSSSLSSWRRISGMSRRCAEGAAFARDEQRLVTARRISPAARTPFDRRELFTMSAICWKPRPARRPARRAPFRLISPLAIERVPSLSFSRTIR
jgi:hypothetical protein